MSCPYVWDDDDAVPIDALLKTRRWALGGEKHNRRDAEEEEKDEEERDGCVGSKRHCKARQGKARRVG